MTEIRHHIVLSMAGAEWHAHTGLLRRGVRSYLPYVLRDSRRGRWLQGSVRPIFPGYLIASLAPDQSLETVKQTFGVRDVLRNGLEVVRLADQQLLDLKIKCRSMYRDSLPQRLSHDNFKPGDWIAVPHGAFAGAPVQIDAIDNSGFIEAHIGSFRVTCHASEVHESAPQSAELTRKSA